MKSAIFSILFVVVLAVVGCARKSKPAKVLPDLGQRLASIGATTAAVAAELPKAADRIDAYAKAVNVKARGVADVQPEIVGLATETAGLRAQANRLAEVPGQVKAAQGDAAKYVTAVDSANARVEKLEDEKRNGLRKLGQSQIGFGALLLAAGVIGFFTGTAIGKTLGTASAAGGVTLIVLGLVVGWYSAYLVIPALGIVVAAFGYYAYRFIVERRATKDLVRTVEITKQAMPDAMRLQLFGNGAMPGVLESSNVQSDTTRAEVKVIRETEGARLAPEVAPVSVNEPGTVPGPAVPVPTADPANIAVANAKTQGA